jgi:hypothetical protein
MSVPKDPANNPQPDVDVTVGRDPVVGDAPPSDGTGADVSVNPTTTAVSEAATAVMHRLALEGSAVRPLESRRFHRAVGAGDVGPSTFHTASARAAAFPGLQPEIESSSPPMPVHGGWAASPDLPAN